MRNTIFFIALIVLVLGGSMGIDRLIAHFDHSYFEFNSDNACLIMLFICIPCAFLIDTIERKLTK